MQIRLPEWAWRALERFDDWANVPVFKLWRFQVLRIDIILAVSFVLCVGVGYYYGGWLGAFRDGLAFIFVAMCSSWMFRK